jgi:hypothetical protein
MQLNSDIRVTDALDIVMDDRFFEKSRRGIVVNADKKCAFYSKNHRGICLEIRRGTTMVARLTDVFYCPHPHRSPDETHVLLRQGDVLNLFVDSDTDARDIYTNVATISWLY